MLKATLLPSAAKWPWKLAITKWQIDYDDASYERVIAKQHILTYYSNRPLPNSPLRSIFSRYFSMTSSFLVSNSSTSQLADIYRPLKNCACGEAKYTAAPAASST